MDRDAASRVVSSLFESWYSSFVRYACRATGSFVFAEDLVQVTFMQLYKELRRGKKINHPKAWSLCVLRREIGKHVRTHLRTSRSHEQLEVEAMDALPGDLSWASQPGIELDDLTKLFSVLTQREEEVLLLRMEPLKYREIAAALGISSNTVNTLLARSGTPLNILSLAVIQGEIISIRPDLILGEPIWIKDPSVPAGKRLNPAAFSLPPAGRGGNLGRNAIKGLSISQVDFALRRRFTLTERTSVQFRTDFFNIFNHPNFAGVNSNIISSTFGQALTMLGRSLGTGGTQGGLNPLFQIGGPRSIQFALKIIF